MLYLVVWNRTIFIRMDLALNNLQNLIYHKTQPTNQPTNQPVLTKTFQQQTAQAIILTNSIWKRNSNALVTWRNRCHLPKFTCITHVTVWYMGVISVAFWKRVRRSGFKPRLRFRKFIYHLYTLKRHELPSPFALFESPDIFTGIFSFAYRAVWQILSQRSQRPFSVYDNDTYLSQVTTIIRCLDNTLDSCAR